MWNCPYCDQKSKRRWNLGIHIERAHPGKFNPAPEMKDRNYGTSKRTSRSISFPDPDSMDLFDRTLLIRFLLLQIDRLDRLELMRLLTRILQRLGK